MTATQALITYLRRLTVSAMAKAAARYQPTSYDDAIAVRDLVVARLDVEILAAGDAGDDATYAALRDLRQAVMRDLTARADPLARLRLYRFTAALPSLYLAQRLYLDPTRADELVRIARPVHPAFMPVQLQALSQ